MCRYKLLRGRMFRFETISILIPAMLQECLIQVINHTHIRLTARFSRHVTAQLSSDGPAVNHRRSGDATCQVRCTTIPCPTNELVSHLSRVFHLAPHWQSSPPIRSRGFGNISSPRVYNSRGLLKVISDLRIRHSFD